MKISKRHPSLRASAVLLAASVAALSGCCHRTAATSRRPPKETQAFVTYDGTKTTLTHFPTLPDKKLAQLSISNQDTIQWCSPNGRVRVFNWTPKSPFDKDPVYKDGCLKAGPPAKGTAGTTFNYEAELWLDATGSNKVKIDPRIEVMD